MKTTGKLARLAGAAILVGGIAGAAFAMPANAASGIVSLPSAPVADSVTCVPTNTARVATGAEFQAAYANSAIRCIVLTADITATTMIVGQDGGGTINHSLEIDGQGHTLTIPSGMAYGNRPFFLQEQPSANADRVFALRNIDIQAPIEMYLVSGQGNIGTGWDVVFDNMTLTGLPGVRDGESARLNVSTGATVFLQGDGSAAKVYGRTYAGRLVVESGADWTLHSGNLAPNEPQLDMTSGTVNAAGGGVWVLGNLDAEGGSAGAIYGFSGVYVGSNGDLEARSNYAGIGYGALTTVDGGRGTGQVWVDDGGTLSIVSPGTAMYAVAGAPLDLRTDPGASVLISGSTDDPRFGAITLATPGSSLQFNDPASLDIKNLGTNSRTNYAIMALADAGAYTYTLSVYDAHQISAWLHSTAVDDNPDLAWSPATLRTDQTGRALTGSGPADLALKWKTTDYRRIFMGDPDQVNVPAINPGVALGVAGVGLAAAATAIVLRRKKAADSTGA